MIRAANHSSFPRVGDTPLDQQVRLVAARHARGAASDADLNDAIQEATTIAVAQQARAFIDIVTDGMIRWDGPLSYPAMQMRGTRLGPLHRWFDSNFYDRRVEVNGALERRGAFLETDYRTAVEVSLSKPVKVVLPGPVTFARLAHDEHYGDLDELADATAEVFAAEFADLATGGVTHFQLDEPLLCRHPEDAERVARTAGSVFAAAGAEATTVLSTYYGDLTGVGDLGVLPGTHLGLDLVAGPANAELLDKLPEGRGVALGVFDARTTRQEDAADVAATLEPHREALTSRDVIVGPNAGLELLPRDDAFDKLLHARYLVEKLSQEWTWA